MPLLFKRMLKPLPVGLVHLVLLMLLVLQFGIPPLALPQQETAPPPSAKQILVLYTYAGGITVNQKATGAFFSVLTSRGFNNDDVFLEYLDLQRNNSPAYRRRVANLLLDKYGKRDIGLIVTVHTGALEFLLEECKGLFPDVPIFSFLVARPELIRAKNTGRRILLRPQNMDMGGTLEIALKMFPETRKVVFVVGAAPADKRFEYEARHIFEPWRGKVEIEYTSDRTYEEMLQLVSTLPRSSIVIYCDVFSDVTGRTFTPLEVGKMVAKAANAPVFCIWDTIMGWGTIGGSLLSFEAEGAYAAKTALDILDKKIVLTKPETTLPTGKTLMFDWRQLRRWGVNENTLPKGSIIINREFTLWDFKYYLIGILVFCLAETALIIFLIVQRRRKKVAEESLRKAEAKYRDIFEGAVEGIFEASPQGQPLTANPALAKMLGYDSPDKYISAIRDSATQVFASPDKRSEYVELLEKEGVVLGFECELLRRDGTKIWGSVNSRRVCDPSGKTLLYSGFLEDITERKRAEEELKKKQEHLEELVEELRKYQGHLEDLVRERTAKLVKAMDQAEAANRAKSAFLANMSHELRAPLNSILGIAQLMERDQEFPSKQRELLEILSRSGQQLFELIDDVLEMSRIEAGQTTTVIKTFDLHRFLDDLEEMMSPRAEKKGLRLIFERNSTLPQYIQTDGRKLRQILLNLLGNAIKFTEKGGVTLRANFKEGLDRTPANHPASPVRLQFEVEDTGIGFAREDGEKIFDPFVQLNPAQETSGGIGLGLAICHKFATLLGGQITVRSQVGRGTTFKLDIGVQPSERPDIPAQEAHRRVTGLAAGQPGYRLLVVDDHLESRLLLRQLLEPVGFRVLEAASGEEAIDLCRKDRPDLIWMDIRMPGMDGYEATRRIREVERERGKEDGKEMHTPIMALTAGVMENTGSPPLSPEFDDWVYKPFREAEVFDKIQKHLGVEFVYGPSVLSTVKPDDARDKAVLSPADLSVLPADWLQEFFQTMEKGRSAQLLNLIDQIRPEHADLARALAELVRIHQYEKLIPLIQGALKGNANG